MNIAMRMPPLAEYDDPQVVVIILNWNSWQCTLQCIESLVQQDYTAISILVVDNGSSDDSVFHIRKWMESCKKETIRHTNLPISLMENDNNLGFAGGNNKGVEQVLVSGIECRYILFLNNDCIVTEGCIKRMVDAMSSSDMAVHAFQVDKQGKPRFAIQRSRFPSLVYMFPYLINWNASYNKADEVISVDWVGGAALLMGKRLILDLKQQDGYVWRPDYFLYCEDDELAFRLRKRGVRMVVPLNAVVEHRSKSGGTKRRSYYTTRNRFLLCRDHFGIVGCIVCVANNTVYALLGIMKGMLLRKDVDITLILMALVDGLLGRRGGK